MGAGQCDLYKGTYGEVKGANGQIKNVIAVYQIDNGSQIPRMITNYVERKR